MSFTRADLDRLSAIMAEAAETEIMPRFRDLGNDGIREKTGALDLVTDAEGFSAPRLGELELSAEQAREYHAFLVRQVVLMLCIGLIHGDLSAYNILVHDGRVVFIDVPQAVAASPTASTKAQPHRHHLTGTLAIRKLSDRRPIMVAKK